MNSFTNKAAIVLASALTLGASAVTSAGARWDMPTPYGDGTHQTQVARSFAEEINAKADGKLTVNIHSGGSLIKHPEIHRAVKTRQVPIGEVFIGRLGNLNPIYKLDNIPFLATDFDSAEKLYKASKPEIQKALAKENLMLLYTSPWPAQDLYTNKEVNSLSDLRGSKMRSYSPTTSRLADLMGTTPVNIPFSDVAQAFTTNAVDAMITSPSTGVNGQSWDYISHFTTVHAWIPKNMVFANKRVFDRLDKETQQVILTAAANAEKKGWEMGRKLAVEHTDALAKNGMKVVEPSKQLIGELEAIGATMIDEWEAEAGESGKAVLEAYQAL
ncbi:TRAP transporter substrate-binding protein [Neptuniibacter caesariensis]|uniref:Probable DctP (Periplasmic C4-dicarboxylate binding protein) n=1 Tax=Neptuniibacter caesariensis TaxID=207954 RepID=A0A7U8C500_NEPCE|nr:TRAP transporter substrate-binding protein [Neptuniibacter caesariensis]EAR61637.1 probable DctP (periplasmic C4-dicarboxylate binding protein) [Oceanospirillum sp. MED92] [Neptuniibacter caesariensis]